MPVLQHAAPPDRTTAPQPPADSRRLPTTSTRRVSRIFLLLAVTIVLGLGATECVYGNTDSGDIYGSDAVQYLDIARAVQQHDWRSAFNPLWSQGYPVLLAVARPLFPSGPVGDWHDTRAVNIGIFAFDLLAFVWLVCGLIGRLPQREEQPDFLHRRDTWLWLSALSVFVATQICLGQPSRAGPDELVSAMFFLACGIFLRLVRPTRVLTSRQAAALGVALGLVLGVGFIVKAVFLLLGCGILLIAVAALWRQRDRRHSSLRALTPAAIAVLCFATLVGAEGAGLTWATGHPTLGEAGSINYAWHVNRLQKWVHWEGGNLPADEAWPKPAIARFAQWDQQPPDFGKPTHPSVILQASPLVYGFAAPVHATYVPYFDPPYWYAGYHHILRPRYQAIALAKNLGDLALVLLKQPLFFVFNGIALLMLASRSRRAALRASYSGLWPLGAVGLFGIAIYLPVHLEGRYLAAFLALLGLVMIAALAHVASRRMMFAATLCLLVGVGGSLLLTQRSVWRNAMHHKSPQQNMEWKVGTAALAQGLAPGSQIGVIAWTPNLHCDWAYIAHLQITSEIGTGKDFDLFWKLPPEQQAATLDTFRRAGAVAVFSYGKPAGAGDSAWQELGNTPMWMRRL